MEQTVSEAIVFFSAQKKILKGLSSLSLVGLGYLKLGQALTTLSGGESKRLKIAAHLSKSLSSQKNSGIDDKHRSLFLFDEPTTGLHLDDIKSLLNAMKKLIDEGH